MTRMALLCSVLALLLSSTAVADTVARRDGEFRDELGPQRIMLDDFFLTVSPTEKALTLVEAQAVRDVAEDVVQAYFDMYDWGKDAIYEYMGFTAVEGILSKGNYTVIRVNGGIVSFDGESKSIPTHDEVQALIQDILDPADPKEPGLTEALQATEDFSYVEETIYEVLSTTTPAPTMTPSAAAATPAPTIVAADEPTVPKIDTEDGEQPTSGEEKAVPILDNSSASAEEAPPRGVSIPAIAGAAAGILVLAAIAGLLVNRRRQRREGWRDSADHTHPEDDDLEEASLKKGLHTRDSAAASDAGSSRLGRLLSATAAAVQVSRHGASSNRSEATPQSSSEDSVEDSFSQFEEISVDMTADSRESVEVQYSPSKGGNSKPMETIESDESAKADPEFGDEVELRLGVQDASGKVIQGAPTLSVEIAAPLAGAGYSRWSDISSNHSQELHSDNDEENQFKPDDSWDFNDNDDDTEETDPFQTPTNMPVNDKKPLLQRLRLKKEDKEPSLRRSRSAEFMSDGSLMTDDNSEVTLGDAFETLASMTATDQKPLLRKLGTYELDKVKSRTSESEKERRSKSVPPSKKSEGLR